PVGWGVFLYGPKLGDRVSRLVLRASPQNVATLETRTRMTTPCRKPRAQRAPASGFGALVASWALGAAAAGAVAEAVAAFACAERALQPSLSSAWWAVKHCASLPFV